MDRRPYASPDNRHNQYKDQVERSAFRYLFQSANNICTQGFVKLPKEQAFGEKDQRAWSLTIVDEFLRSYRRCGHVVGRLIPDPRSPRDLKKVFLRSYFVLLTISSQVLVLAELFLDVVERV